MTVIPDTQEEEVEGLCLKASLSKMLLSRPDLKNKWVRCFMLVIPATPKAEVSIKI
jgi:hypothetical protein